MQMMQRLLAMAGLVIVLCAGEAHAGERLTTTDLKQLFPGHFQAVVKNSIIVSIVALADGSLTGSILGASDTGRWSIRSGRLCIMLNSWLKGRTNCTMIIQEAGWYKGTDVKFRPI